MSVEFDFARLEIEPGLTIERTMVLCVTATTQNGVLTSVMLQEGMHYMIASNGATYCDNEAFPQDPHETNNEWQRDRSVGLWIKYVYDNESKTWYTAADLAAVIRQREADAEAARLQAEADAEALAARALEPAPEPESASEEARNVAQS